LKPSIKDVAKACNVSITTVSLVLNDRPNRISEDTKDLIRKTADSMNYRPNLISRSLVTKQSGIIGLIVPNIKDSFYSDLTQDIINIMAFNMYTVLVGSTGMDPELEKSYIQRFIDYRVEAIIISKEFKSDDFEITEIIEILEKSKIPYIFTDNLNYNTSYPHITVNQTLGGYLATKHLLDLGHKKIAFLSGCSKIILNKLRINGYKEALNEFKIEWDEELIIEGNSTLISESNILNTLLEKGVTAVASSNDTLTYGVYKMAREMNLKIPKDISIVCFGNSKTHELVDPPLTCIAPPTKQIAKDIINILMNLINNSPEYVKFSYKPELIIRKSTTHI